MDVAEALKWGSEHLRQAGVDTFELDARLLLESVLYKSRTELYLAAHEALSPEKNNEYDRLIRRRMEREPVAYILGQQEFWSLNFNVTPDVLIPRPETEFLLEQVFARAVSSSYDCGAILDLCCGSGVIATVLAKEKGKKVYAADISMAALHVTGQNSTLHGVADKVLPVQGNLLTGFAEKEQFSLVVSNPPYVSHLDVIKNLEPEVCMYEPHLALDGGVKGLELIGMIRIQLEHRMRPGAELFMEIGADQGEAVLDIFASSTGTGKGFHKIEILKDYAGRDRVVHAVKI